MSKISEILFLPNVSNLATCLKYYENFMTINVYIAMCAPYGMCPLAAVNFAIELGDAIITLIVSENRYSELFVS